MSKLPEWVSKGVGDLYHSQYEVECEDHHRAMKLEQALAIAWEALSEMRSHSGRDVYAYEDLAKDALKRIEALGK